MTIFAVGLNVVFLSYFSHWNGFKGCCSVDTVQVYPVIPNSQAAKKQAPKQHNVKHVKLTSRSNANYGSCGETQRASNVWRLSQLQNHWVMDILCWQLLYASRSDRRDPTSMLCSTLAYKKSCAMVTFKWNWFEPHKMVHTQGCNSWLL